MGENGLDMEAIALGAQDSLSAETLSGWSEQLGESGVDARQLLETLPLHREVQKVKPENLGVFAQFLGDLSARLNPENGGRQVDEMRAWVEGMAIPDDLRAKWTTEIALDGTQTLSIPDSDKILGFLAKHGFSKDDLALFYAGGGAKVKEFDGRMRAIAGADQVEMSKLLNWLAGEVDDGGVKGRLQIAAAGVLYRDMSDKTSYPDDPGNRGEALKAVVNSVGGERVVVDMATGRNVQQMDFLKKCVSQMMKLPVFPHFFDSTIRTPVPESRQSAFSQMNNTYVS